jgi:hypothetical protein
LCVIIFWSFVSDLSRSLGFTQAQKPINGERLGRTIDQTETAQ